MRKFIKFLSLTLAFVFVISGCKKTDAPLDPADTVQIVKKDDGYAIVQSKNQLDYSKTVEYVLGILENSDMELPEFEYNIDSVFSLSDLTAPAYGDIFPGQAVEDTASALFNSPEIKDIYTMQSPCISLELKDEEGGYLRTSGVFCGLPFYYTMRYSASVINEDGSVSISTAENVTLETINLRFYNFSYTGKEVETFISMRDSLTGLLGPAKNRDDSRYNPYVDYTLEEMPTLEELPESTGVTWQIDNSVENPWHYLVLHLYNGTGFYSYPYIEITLV